MRSSNLSNENTLYRDSINLMLIQYSMQFHLFEAECSHMGECGCAGRTSSGPRDMSGQFVMRTRSDRRVGFYLTRTFAPRFLVPRVFLKILYCFFQH